MSVSTQTHIQIIAPADADRFQCTGCGGCCRLWSIPIDKASFDKTKAFLENPPAPRPNTDMPWYQEIDGENYYELTDKGTCVFLDTDNKCYLHKHDPMLKSRICRDYPRLGVRTPRAYEIYMTFSSFGAFLNVLCRPEPFGLASADMPFPKEMEGITAEEPITHPQSYGWDTFFLVEDILLDFIGRMDNLDDALIASARFLAALEREKDDKKLRRRLKERSLHPLSFMEHPPLSNLEAAYNLVEHLLQLKIEFFRGHPKMRSVVEDLECLIHDLRTGPEEEKTGRALHYRRLRRNFYDPGAARLTPILRKFILHKIFQKTFFLQFGFVRGFNILCFIHAIVRLRLMVRARKAGRPAQVPDLFDPIHFAETHFTHAGSFLNFWRNVFQSGLLSSPSLSEILVRQ